MSFIDLSNLECVFNSSIQIGIQKLGKFADWLSNIAALEFKRA